MKIKLKDSINSELTSLRLKAGMVISSNDVNLTTGAVQFDITFKGSTYNCVVWPEDYEIIENYLVSQAIAKAKPATEITLQMAVITETLDAMYWCFFPYLDDNRITDYPWLLNLVKSYNKIVESLPSPWDLQYEIIEI